PVWVRADVQGIHLPKKSGYFAFKLHHVRPIQSAGRQERRRWSRPGHQGTSQIRLGHEHTRIEVERL
ncbi:hypothetical protein HWV62_8247, partial [Athelia sp. TMB]